uniref:Uncharacterized protein n=1 Tax=Tanacetum cinerariifolium TaxID=118510 RepID=A0A6L2LIT4_TANCI|nr:hypothetical protein [Tanacetum cinerariifolium]
MLHICPRTPSQSFDELPFEAKILEFLSRNIDYAFLIWEDFVYQVEHKNHKKSNEMYYPRFTKALAVWPQSWQPLRGQKDFWLWLLWQVVFLAATVSFGVATIVGLGDATAFGGVVDESKPLLFLLALALGLDSEDDENDEKDQGFKDGEEEWFNEEEEADELYRDQESSSVSSQFVTSMLNPISDASVESIFATASSSVAPLPTPTPTMTSSIITTITTTSHAPIPPTPIPSKVLQNLPTSSHSSRTSYAVAADLSEMELKKIFIEKMEGDKIILDTYGERVILKKRREGPSDGSDQGSKRQREGKDSESAQEPVQTTCQIKEPSHSVFETGAEDQPIVQTSQHPECAQTWISELAKQADSRSSFNELLDTLIDFSKFIMNQLRVDTLTTELLAGPTYELMDGSCKSLTELEYHLEEVYKATTDQLDWINPEGHQYPHNLLHPLSLIPDNRGHRVIPFAHFINNDLEYLRGGSSSQKYTTSMIKTKAADYRHIKWIEDLVPHTIWIHEPINYDKHALWGVSHWGRKRQIEQSMNAQLESKVLTRSSHSSRTSYAVAADLSETELKKILIEKMEGDKIILDTYGERVILKKRHDDDDDQGEGPFDGSDQGSKRQREGKDSESARAPLEPATKSAGRSTIGSKSRQASASESAFPEEPVQTTCQIEEPSHSVFETGAEDQPIVQTSEHPECAQTWISELAKQADSRSSFNELLDTLIDFSNFIMNQLGVDTLTTELLAGPTYELMDGSCKSLTELEYHLEEVYKATTDQLDWINPEGHQYPHNLLHPLSLIPDNRGHRVIPFAHFINNDLEYLQGVTDLKIVEWHNYKHLDWISDVYKEYRHPAACGRSSTGSQKLAEEAQPYQARHVPIQPKETRSVYCLFKPKRIYLSKQGQEKQVDAD